MVDDINHRLGDAVEKLQQVLNSSTDAWDDLLVKVSMDYVLGPDALSREFERRVHFHPRLYQILNNPAVVDSNSLNEALGWLHETITTSRQHWTKSLAECANEFDIDPDYLRLEYQEQYGTAVDEHWNWEWSGVNRVDTSGEDWGSSGPITARSVELDDVARGMSQSGTYSYAPDTRFEAWKKLKTMAEEARRALDIQS